MTSKSSNPIEIPAEYADPARQINVIAELARNAAGVETGTFAVDGIGLPASIPVKRTFGTDPTLGSVKALAEEWRLHPERKTGTAKVDTLESFIDLSNRHKTVESAIFASTDWQKPTLTAVIDYHHNASPRADWCKHRVHYAFPASEQWKTWVAMNGKTMSQADFAAFIEDNIADLSSPQVMEVTEFEGKFMTKIATPSELITLSRGLQVHVSSKAANAVTLQSGEGEIVWNEVHNDATGKKLVVPGLFMLQIPLFHMGEAQRVPVRLRYRVREGTVTWLYQMWRPDIAVTERVLEDFEKATGATALPGFIGSPEQAA